jgi:hypothetical protein
MESLYTETDETATRGLYTGDGLIPPYIYQYPNLRLAQQELNNYVKDWEKSHSSATKLINDQVKSFGKADLNWSGIGQVFLYSQPPKVCWVGMGEGRPNSTNSYPGILLRSVFSAENLDSYDDFYSSVDATARFHNSSADLLIAEIFNSLKEKQYAIGSAILDQHEVESYIMVKYLDFLEEGRSPQQIYNLLIREGSKVTDAITQGGTCELSVNKQGEFTFSNQKAISKFTLSADIPFKFDWAQGLFVPQPTGGKIDSKAIISLRLFDIKSTSTTLKEPEITITVKPNADQEVIDETTKAGYELIESFGFKYKN